MPTSGPLRVGMVGCGKIADGHVEEIRKLASLATLVGVCDREPLMAEQLAARYGVERRFASLEDMLAERPDVVHITTPPESHLAIARQALAAGCHLFVEKPLTPRHEDTIELLEAVQTSGRQLTVGYTYLFDPPALAARDIVNSGDIGEVVHTESYFGYDLSGPYGSALLADPSHWVHRLPGGVIQNNLDHVLYKALEFVEDDRPRVMATAITRREARHGDVRDRLRDEMRCIVQGERTSAYGTFSGHARPRSHVVRLYGTKGTLQVDFVSRTVIRDPESGLPSALGRLFPPFSRARRHFGAGVGNLIRFARSDFHFFAGFNALLRAFYQSILEGGPPPIAYRDMLRVSFVMDAVLDQIAAES